MEIWFAKYGKKTIFRNGIRDFIINNYEKEVIKFYNYGKSWKCKL